MVIPTDPIGSIPLPQALIDAIVSCGDGMDESLDPLYGEAIRDTISRFEATGSPSSAMASTGNTITSDLQRRRARKHGARWISHPLRRGARAAHAAPHERPISL
jgi:hypothetical protein